MSLVWRGEKLVEMGRGGSQWLVCDSISATAGQGPLVFGVFPQPVTLF